MERRLYNAFNWLNVDSTGDLIRLCSNECCSEGAFTTGISSRNFFRGEGGNISYYPDLNSKGETC